MTPVLSAGVRDVLHVVLTYMCDHHDLETIFPPYCFLLDLLLELVNHVLLLFAPLFVVFEAN